MHVRRKTSSLGLALLVLLAGASRPHAGVEPSPFAPQDNMLGSIVNTLDAAVREMQRLFFQPGGSAGRAPEGLAGALGAMTQRIRVAEGRLSEVARSLPADPDTLPARTLELLHSTYTGVSEIDDLARRARGYTRDETILSALDGLRTVTGTVTSVLVGRIPSLDRKRAIPLRFVEVHACDPGGSSATYLDRDTLLAVSDAMNRAFGPAGASFWPKSVERYEMCTFASTTLPADYTITFYDARDELLQALPVENLSIPPESRTPSSWLGYAATVYGDRSELLVWVVASDSVVGRKNSASVSSFPEWGRASTLIASNVAGTLVSPNHVVHELGHYFGLPHTWEGPRGVNPHTMEPRTWADMWDLAYCPGELGFPIGFSSADAARAAQCDFTTVEANPCPCGQVDANDDCTCPVSPNCAVDNRTGTTDSAMACFVAGSDFFSGDWLLKGLTFPTGLPENPPSASASYWDPWSFAWGLNVMGYYSRYWAHLWTPGLFSQSQLHLIRGYLENDVDIADNYAPYHGLRSDFTQLGLDTVPHVWWSNRNFTFGRVQLPGFGVGRVPIVGDFNATGTDDIFWFNEVGEDAIWWVNSDRSSRMATNLQMDGAYQPFAGDFDGNGTSDIFWYRPGPDADTMWWFSLSAVDKVDAPFTVDGGYVPVVGNFDGLAGDDIIWYNAGSGTANIWWSNGDRTFTHQDHVPVGEGFAPHAGDFDGDGVTDVYWYRRGPATDMIWWGQGAKAFSPQSDDPVQMSLWAAPIVGDFDGDGRTDILWDAPFAQADGVWRGTEARGFEPLRVMVRGSFASAVGDFDRDGASDIFRYMR